MSTKIYTCSNRSVIHYVKYGSMFSLLIFDCLSMELVTWENTGMGVSRMCSCARYCLHVAWATFYS
jgi:hypothetical protein